MADQNQPVDFVIDFSPHTEYTPYSGEGASDRVPFDGFVEVTLIKASGYWTKPKDGSPAKPAAKVAAVIEDQDAKGLRLIDDVLCGGKDKNGDDLGRQFMDLLVSSGTTVDKIQANAKAGAKANASALFPALQTKKAYAEVEADVYEGKETTKVKNWITKERYEQAKVIGAHRKPRRAVAQAQVQGQAAGYNVGGGQAQVNGQTGQPAPAPTGTSAMPML